jgi:type II secretory pathway component PulF
VVRAHEVAMAEFHWKGRTSGGQEVKGCLTAGSKEEVIARLRAQGVLVQSLEETRAVASTAPFPPSPTSG